MKHPNNFIYLLATFTLAIPTLFFLIPILWVPFASVESLKKFDTLASVKNRFVLTQTNIDPIGDFTPPLNTSDKLVQTFFQERKHLIGFSIIVNTYNKPLSGEIRVAVKSSTDVVYDKFVDLSQISPDLLYAFTDMYIYDQCFNGCTVEISVVSTNEPFRLWVEDSKRKSKVDKLYLSNDTINGSIIIQSFYYKDRYF